MHAVPVCVTCVGCSRTPTNSQDDEGAEEGGGLSKHGLEVQRLLKRAGLSESDEDASLEVTWLPEHCAISCESRQLMFDIAGGDAPWN